MSVQKQVNDKSAITRFVNYWNGQFPIDYWWRQKYKVPFGSIEHRNFSFLDQLFEFEEDQMIRNLINKKETKKEDIYLPNRNQFLKKRKLSEEELDILFEKLGEDEDA